MMPSLRLSAGEQPMHEEMDRKVDVRLPANGDSKSHGARPAHPIITMIKWIWTSGMAIKNYLLEKNGERLGCNALIN